MLIYVSGPLTIGDSAEHVHNAIKVAEALIEKGHAVILPQLSQLWQMVSPKPWEYWLDMDLKIIPRCDALFRCYGISKGAAMEVQCAQEHEIPVYYELEQVPNATTD